jgi:CBS domain containing-hemolysin-like protein
MASLCLFNLSHHFNTSDFIPEQPELAWFPPEWGQLGPFLLVVIFLFVDQLAPLYLAVHAIQLAQYLLILPIYRLFYLLHDLVDLMDDSFGSVIRTIARLRSVSHSNFVDALLDPSLLVNTL